jgi:hypothetical protein
LRNLNGPGVDAMSHATAAVLIGGAIVFVAMTRLCVRSTRRSGQTLARLFLACGLLLITGFCAFGFLAAGEHTGLSEFAWRIAYGLAGAAALIGAAYLVLPPRRA